jgi:hypothetical protein
MECNNVKLKIIAWWLHTFVLAVYLGGVCREKFNFHKTVEVCQVPLIELMCVDGNDESTGELFL